MPRGSNFWIVSFVLWELPSLIAISVHQAICAATGRPLSLEFLGIWSYRAIGVMVVWPASVGLAIAASKDGPAGGVGVVLLTVLVGIFIWSRISHRGR